MLNNDEILNIKNAVIQAGNVILEYQLKQNYQIDYKAENDPVTTADFAANKIIIECIEKILPADSIISEENYNTSTMAAIDDLRKKSKRLWIIDPLDGTKDFIKGLPYFAVSVGFWYDGTPDYGFIYNPAKKFLVQGGKNYGTFLNGRAFDRPQNNPQTLQELKICISTSEIKQNLFPELLNALPEDNIEFIGSVAYKLGLVVSGDFDLILSRREKADWDIAAGVALLQNPDMEVYDQHLQPVRLNKDNVYTNGLIVGSKKAVDIYKAFLNCQP